MELRLWAVAPVCDRSFGGIKVFCIAAQHGQLVCSRYGRSLQAITIIIKLSQNSRIYSYLFKSLTGKMQVLH